MRRIPAYQKTSGVSGNITSVGSDTMNNMMALWAEAFRKMYPNVKIQIEGKGSSTAPAGADRRHLAVRPDVARHARDRDRPVRGEVRLQADAAPHLLRRARRVREQGQPAREADARRRWTRSSRRRGARGGKAVVKWGDLGLSGDWATRPISLYGRNSASGTYGFFKEHVLKNGDYRDQVKEQPGSASVVQGVTEDRFGIGYSGIGYRTSGVKVLALAEKEGAYSSGSYEDVVSGKYPLSRFLYLYVNKAPGKPLDPLVKEFLKLILSKEGQEVVVKDGYLPLSAEIAQAELAKIE